MKTAISIYGAHLLTPEADRTVNTIIRRAAAIGFDGIDLGYYWPENRDRRTAMSEAGKVAENEGIAVANYISRGNFGNAIAEHRLPAEIELVKQALEEAAFLGCPALRVFAGGYDLDWHEYSGRIAEAFAACVEFAQAAGVVMALEDHGALCKNSEQQLFYLKAVNSPYLRLLSDIGNYWSHAGESPLAGVTATAPFACMVHVKDLRHINHQPVAVPVGEGEIDFTACFRALQAAGYDGYLSLEYECAFGRGVDGIVSSLAHIRRCLDAIGREA